MKKFEFKKTFINIFLFLFISLSFSFFNLLNVKAEPNGYWFNDVYAGDYENMPLNVYQTSNGDVIVTGSGSNSSTLKDFTFTARYSQAGALIWKQSYSFGSTSYQHKGYSTVEMADGSILLLIARTTTSGSDFVNGDLLKLNGTTGAIIWGKTFSLASSWGIYDRNIMELFDNGNGEIAIFTNSGSNDNPMMYIINQDGTFLRGSSFTNYNNIYKVEKVSDGYIFSSYPNAFKISNATTPSIVWAKSTTPANGTYYIGTPMWTQKKDNSGYFICGTSFNSYPVIVSLDNNFQVLWKKYLSNYSYCHDIVPATDGVVVMVQEASSYKKSGIIKLNNSGAIVFTNFFISSVSGYTGARGSITNAIDGGYIFTGMHYYSSSIKAYGVAKVNESGVCPNCGQMSSVNTGIADMPTTYTFANISISRSNSGLTLSSLSGLSSNASGANISRCFAEAGNKVENVPAGIVINSVSDWSTDLSQVAQTGVIETGIKDLDTNNKIVAINIDFSEAVDMTDVSADSSVSKAFFHIGGASNLSTITGGASTSYTLYIPKGDGDKVWICPGASSLSGVTLSCSGGYFLTEGQTFNGATARVSLESDGVTYWKVDGLTGTGGMSVVTGLKDTLSRLQTGVGSDHTITFGTNNGLTASGQFLVLAFDPSGYGFDLSSLTISDIVLTDNIGNDRTLASSSGVNTWGVEIDSNLDTITFFSPTSGTGYYPAASQIVIKIGTNAGGINQIINPSTTGSYEETIYILNTDMEGGTVQLPIIDSDRVDITGYVTAYMHFDIDTGVGEVPGVDPAVDCNYDTCLIHQNGGAGSNYTVDLGELTSAVVNKSNTTSVAHTSGGNGIINSIYFDITTNAPSGAVVTVKSANGGLQGPGTNMIPSIGVSVGADGVTRADGEDIPANSGVYGYNLPVASSQLHGSIIPNSLCDSLIEFCGAGLTPKTIFTTNNLPVDTARVRMDLAAAANYTNNPGLYTDTLTFIATSTF